MSDASFPVTGLVVRYNYLWARQYEQGEESGRKARPACVAVPVGATTGEVVLFPITTQQPSPDRVTVEVPEIERRRLRLTGQARCWLILDEGNHDVLPGSFHLEPIRLDPPNLCLWHPECGLHASGPAYPRGCYSGEEAAGDPS